MQNAFTVLQEESEEEDDDVQTVITQMAALTTQSQLTATTTAETSASVAAAINQLHANQQAMQQQFAAFTTQRNMTYHPAPTMQPPITQFSIPNIASFNTTGRGGGRRGGHGRGGRANFVTTAGGRTARTPFANFVGRCGQGGLPHIGGGGGRGGGVLPFAQQAMPRNAAPMYSNIIKKYANWNVCFSCGFDVKDGHTWKTCPAPWRRANHQEGFDRNNTGQYIAVGYDACTKAMHKSQMPNM